MNREIEICAVCGFLFANDKYKDPWPFIMCPCCLFEYGIEDFDTDCYSIAREKWIKKGMPFGVELIPALPWTHQMAIQQLENLKRIKLEDYPAEPGMNPNFSSDFNADEIKYHWNKAREERNAEQD